MTPEERAEARRLLDDHELSNAEPPHGPEHYLRLALDALEGAEQDLSELQQTFDLRRAADMRAIARWREAHPGKELVIPDRADLCVWLFERLERAERERAELEEHGRVLAQHHAECCMACGVDTYGVPEPGAAAIDARSRELGLLREVERG